MLDKATAKILEENILKRINEIYPEDSTLSNAIARVATQVVIISIQEYEKLSTNTD